VTAWRGFDEKATLPMITAIKETAGRFFDACETGKGSCG
jgi:hypothetical protein